MSLEPAASSPETKRLPGRLANSVMNQHDTPAGEIEKGVCRAPEKTAVFSIIIVESALSYCFIPILLLLSTLEPTPVSYQQQSRVAGGIHARGPHEAGRSGASAGGSGK